MRRFDRSLYADSEMLRILRAMRGSASRTP